MKKNTMSLVGLMILVFIQSIFSGVAWGNNIVINETKLSEKMMSGFPVNSSTADITQLKEAVKNAIVGSNVKPGNIINISITSDWKESSFPITSIPYRTINASVLYHDNNNNDGVCQFGQYEFISVNGATLKYKAMIAGTNDGWTNCDEAISANGGLANNRDEFLSSLIWILLVLVNLLAGTLILKGKILSIKALNIDAIKGILCRIESLQAYIGYTAIVIGGLSFLMVLLSSFCIQLDALGF